MQSVISQILNDACSLKERVLADNKLMHQIEASSRLLIECVNAGGTIYSCGNGGSTSDAIHLTEELVGRYKRERRGIKAMHMMDPALITCWSNDYAFDNIFERQVETFCTKNDVLVAISTSGNSKNVLKGVIASKKLGCKVIALTGKEGGQLAPLADIPIVIPDNATERIQEMHITIIHIFCELIETNLAPNPSKIHY